MEERQGLVSWHGDSIKKIKARRTRALGHHGQPFAGLARQGTPRCLHIFCFFVEVKKCWGSTFGCRHDCYYVLST